ncbi:hypothetical protein, variant [Aphanomyces invadans]|uniref:Nucleoside diphosphate kinase-like domain-containing protein n=1 Tax=Aphanomyces invadans TaxID=157072 RepID=A0A024TA09_9STRA|nr:hypothetical protein, variant [Aphanomyces invadans]ETV90431.1 hypothetical protein, variant [Aphanomyces invadans]|eukprot:XP_008880950.1 hypothetical protein, variant [Aphanomyces invadans]
MEWTARDETLLRQCVFECAYDFDAAATVFLQRIPKQRKLSLGEHAITPRVIELKYMELSELEEGDQEDNDGRVVEVQPVEGLKGASTSDDATLVVVASSDLPVLELPLSEFDVDLMLQDIPTDSLPRDSEMQWVLSYLEDPTNSVDEAVYNPSQLGIEVGRYSGCDLLAQLDLAFQASRERSCGNRSVDNLLAPHILSLAKEDEGGTREPSKVAATDDNDIPDLVALSPVQTIMASGTAAPSTPPPSYPIDEDVDVEQSEDGASDTSSDAEDWNSARRLLKDRTTVLPPQQPSPLQCDEAWRSEDDDKDDSVDGGDATEAMERQLMKLWKRDVELQEQEFLGTHSRDAAETARFIREEMQALLHVAAPSGSNVPPRRQEDDGDQRQFLGYKNPYALDEREVSSDNPPIEATALDIVRSHQERRERASTSIPAAPCTKPSTADSPQRAVVPVPRKRGTIAPPEIVADTIADLVEESILASVDELSEALYHRQLSQSLHVPTLPRSYWQRLFTYGTADCEDDSELLDDVHVLALQGADSTDDAFGTIVQLFCQLQHEPSSPCTLLGLQYTVVLPGQVSLQSPPQGHPDAIPVLFIALQCESAYIDAILHSPMESFLPGNEKALGDYLVRVPFVTPSPSATSTALLVHPIHLFTRLPTFQVFHNHLPHRHYNATTVVVLRDPAAHVLDVLYRTRPLLDVVGLKLCFDATFEPHVVVSPDVATATCLVAMAFRGIDATTVVRDVLHDVPKTHVYLPHGALQAHRDVVHWFGGRVNSVITNSSSELLPRARPVYGVVLKPDQVVAMHVSVTSPNVLGRVLSAVASAGYELLGLNLIHGHDDAACHVQLTMLKENGANVHRLAHLQSTVVDIDDVIATNVAPQASEFSHGELEPATQPGTLPPLFVDYDREQTLLAVLMPIGDNHARETAAGSCVGVAMEHLLGACASDQLVGVKVIHPRAVDAVCDTLMALQCVAFGPAASTSLPLAPAVVVLFRHLVEDGQFRKSFRRLTATPSIVRLYTDPAIVRALLPVLFERSEYAAPRRLSPRDLCFPPTPRTDADAFAGLFQTAPSTSYSSVLVIKPDDPLGVLPVVLRRLARDGFEIVFMHMTLLPSSSPPAVGNLYVSDSQRLHMASQPSILLVVRRINCIARLHALVGPSDPDTARQDARFTLVAGYGIDHVRNGFYTSPTYAQARWDLHSVYGVRSDDDYNRLARRAPSAAISAPFMHTSPPLEPTTFTATPRTLVETTLLIVGGAAVHAASELVASLAMDGGFLIVNLAQGGLTLEQKLHCAGHFASDLLDGPWLVLALERDNAVSRLATYLPTTSVYNPASRQLFRWSTSAKAARADLPLFFHVLYGSVHSLEPGPPPPGRHVALH